VTARGALVSMEVPTAEHSEEIFTHVVGYIPGTGSEQDRTGAGMNRRALDDRVIMVSAYYDGLGVGRTARSIQELTTTPARWPRCWEIARVYEGGLASSPRRRWSLSPGPAAERGESLSVSNIMGAKSGFNLLEVEVVIELSGVGRAAGTGIALGRGQQLRLVQLFQDAAGRLGVSTTTRGADRTWQRGRPAFGGRSALSLYLSWDGSDQTAHLPADDLGTVDPRSCSSWGGRLSWADRPQPRGGLLSGGAKLSIRRSAVWVPGPLLLRGDRIRARRKRRL